MKILAVSDLHLDPQAAEDLLAAAPAADLVICAGDLANQHEGLPDYAARLEPIAQKTVMVPGNNESLEALRAATTGTVLHGETIRRGSLTIAGIGGGIPPLPPMPWHSWDLTEEAARTLLDGIENADILVSHSPGRLQAPPATAAMAGSREFPFTLDLRRPAPR